MKHKVPFMKNKGVRIDFKPRKIIKLGSANTIGQLRELIEGYSDDTSFGFRNQPMQALFEVNDSGLIFVVFQ